MSTATLDRLLAVLIGAQLLTGLLTLRAGSPPTAPLFVGGRRRDGRRRPHAE